MAFDGTLKFDTAIDKTGFKLGIDSLGSLAKSGMSLVSSAFSKAGSAVADLGKYSIDVGKNFESSMAQVIATMGITKDTVENGVNSYDLLKKAAADAGESTTFSASEAADALNYLALAGYSATQSADALPQVLNLASAGGLDLAYASDLATDAMAALGIEANGENLQKFGDEMAKTASKSNTSVAQLGEAILTVGGTAKELAGGTVELNTALGVLANVGIKGSEGGTALRNIMLAMTPTTDKATSAFERLNLESYDANGNLRPLNETFRDLNKAISGMTSQEKTEVLNDIFNKVDLKSASAMLAACASSTEDLGNAFLYAGVPAENLETFLENFNDGGTFHVDETGKVTADKITITGGSINIKTDDENFDVISLNYGNYGAFLSPSGLIFKDFSSNRMVNINHGGFFIYKDYTNPEDTIVFSVRYDNCQLDISSGIYSSGNISAKDIHGNNIRSEADITANGVISCAGNITGNGIYGQYLHSNGDVGVVGGITANGDIKSGGNISGNEIYADNLHFKMDNGNNYSFRTYLSYLEERINNL